MASLDFLTGMTFIVGTVVTGLCFYLVIQIYRGDYEEKHKEEASKGSAGTKQ